MQRSTASFRKKALIRAGQIPREIIGDLYEPLKIILIGWGKARERTSWEEYASKIAPDIRDKMAQVFKELRRNGYYNPRVREDRIVVDFCFIRETDQRQDSRDLCTVCERECSRKDVRGVFKTLNGSVIKKCWEEVRI